MILAIVAIAFNACKPESTGELGDPFDKVAGMAGTWELSSFTQQDLNSPVKETRDLSAFYIDGTVTPLPVDVQCRPHLFRCVGNGQELLR